MKQFIIEVPEEDTDDCNKCPFLLNENVCRYLNENNKCNTYNFIKLHIKEIENERP